MPYLFLQDWAAKMHFTIAVDNTATLSPGFTYTSPLDKTVATRLIPATTELFTLGVGAGLTTEAVRTEDVEFLISFSDLKKEFQDESTKTSLYNNCNLINGFLLESDFELDSVFESALDPIKEGILKPGRNVGPGTLPVATPPSQRDNRRELESLRIAATGLPEPPQNKSLEEISKNVTDKSIFNKIINNFKILPEDMSKSLSDNIPVPSRVSAAIRLQTYINDAETIEKRVQSVINNVVKPLYSISSNSFEGACLKNVTSDQYQAITWSANVSIWVNRAYSASDLKDESGAEVEAVGALKKAKDAAKEVVNFATKMMDEMDVCSKKQKQMAKKTPTYDPVDVIGETVNFFVTSSGSIAPGRKLTRVTAPLAATLFSASRKDTNTLILAMGRPAPAAAGGITANSAVNNQILAGILSQAITSGQRLGQ
jgi:hypothetical protein